MKTFNLINQSSIISGFLFACLTPASAVTYLIKQVQEGPDSTESGISSDVYFEDIDVLEQNKTTTGTHVALLPIGDYGSTFYFYVAGLDPNEPPYLLDQKFVGQYVATADVKVTSDDPHIPARVRSDENIYTEFSTDNQRWKEALVSGTAPELGWDPTKIRVVTSYVNDAGESAELYDPNNPPEDTSDPYYEYTAGESDRRVGLTWIPSEIKYHQRGTETVTAMGMANVDTWRQVSAGSIQVWPIAQGAIKGLFNGKIIVGSMPTVTIELFDLYPHSHTYAEIYKGTPTLKAPVTVPLGSALRYNGSTPNGTKETPGIITVENWDEHIKEDGVYTLQVVTKTPFDKVNPSDDLGAPERILAVTFTVKRSIKLHGNINSSE